MNLEENNNLGFPTVKIVENEISEDMKAVSLIIRKLTDILTERFGYDVAKDLLDRINEEEVEG